MSTITALADESMDIANHKRLVVYAKTVSKDMTPETPFLANVECTEATGIAETVLSEF